MAVHAMPCRNCRDNRMADAMKETSALAGVIDCVLVKNLRHSIARCRGHKFDAEAASYPFPKGFRPATPLWRRVRCLLISARQQGFRDRIRAKRIEFEEMQFLSFG